MDFVFGLPPTKKGYDAIWFIIDRLTKSAHFLPIKITYSLDRLAKVYIEMIVRLHGAPLSIVSNRDLTLLFGFGQVFKKPWVLSGNFILNSMLKLLGSQSRPFKYYRVCLKLMY